MTKEIQSNHTSFSELTYTLSAVPVFPFLKIEGFAPEGVSWEDVEVASVNKGADGKTYINKKPVVYKCTMNLLANSPARNVLDALIDAGTVSFGKTPVKYELVLTVKNNTTGLSKVYSGGEFEQEQGGDNADMDNGQGTKTYRMAFGSRIILPM